MMEAIEFKAKIKNGIIQIPRKYSQKVGDTVTALSLKSANKALAFQRDYRKYLWGNNDDDSGDTVGFDIDLTSSTALEQIVKFVKPKLCTTYICGYIFNPKHHCFHFR